MKDEERQESRCLCLLSCFILHPSSFILLRRIGMSALCPAPRKDRDAPPPAAPAAVELHYAQTESFAPLLQELRVSLLVSTYQANKLLAVRANGGGLST